MRFGDFFRAHVAGGGAAGGDGAGRGYLAQHGLFDQVPSLQADILRPDYCALGEGAVSVRREPNPRRRCRPPLPAPAPEPRRAASLQAVNAWIGGAGTVTPAHTDPEHNLFCQVVGSKYVRLYAPAHTEALYPHPSGLCTNTSQACAPAPQGASAARPAASSSAARLPFTAGVWQVDFFAADCDERFPLFRSAPFVDVTLRGGEALYIPPGWWHFVQALSPSASVSFWWA